MSTHDPLVRKPHSAEGAVPKTITMRRLSWRPEETIEVTLVKRHSYTEGYDNGDDVYLDGKWIGTVGKYIGSLDRKVGRLRHPGKQRTLWSAQGTDRGARSLHGFVSRADAIRWLL